MFKSRKRKVTIPIELLNELYTINWFDNCGKQDVEHFIFAHDKSNIKNASEWENTVLYYRGIVTEALSDRERSGQGREYREWNRVVADFKKNELPELEKAWKEKLKKNRFLLRILDKQNQI